MSKPEQNPCNFCGKTIREQKKGCKIIHCYRQHLNTTTLLVTIENTSTALWYRGYFEVTFEVTDAHRDYYQLLNSNKIIFKEDCRINKP